MAAPSKHRENIKKRGRGGPIAIYYCWTCGVNTPHVGKDCTCKKQGHKDETRLDNRMGGNA
eukprot:1013066-Ditylum_brightwellii.AAC.1